MDKHQMLSRLIQEAMESPMTSRAEVATLALLNEIWDELKEICARTGSEAVEDAEPDPFQTLNGPSKDTNPLRYGVKGEYGE